MIRLKPLKKYHDKQEHSAEVEKLSHDARGIAHIDGKTTFLFNALPGEKVLFSYTKRNSRFDEGTVTQILQASPQRQTPACAHFGTCGGCSLQHMDQTTQIAYKQAIILELLAHQHIYAQEILPPIYSEAWGYRHKARLGSKYLDSKNKFIIGFRERNGRLIADLAACEVLHPHVGKNIEALKTMMASLENRAYVPQIEVSIGDDETAIIIRHLKPISENDLQILQNFSQQQNWKLYLQSGGLDSIILAWPQKADELLHYTLPHFNLNFYFHPAQFTQVNPQVNQAMVSQAVKLLELDTHDRVLDLFCGIGNFTLAIAQQCQYVVGIEGDPTAVKQAEYNARINRIENAEFISTDLTHAPKLPSSMPRFSKIILDPPRSGAKEIIEWITQQQASHIVYISCNPTTFTRDAMLLVENGYQLAKLGIIDMFPHTQHVETMALFMIA